MSSSHSPSRFVGRIKSRISPRKLLTPGLIVGILVFAGLVAYIFVTTYRSEQRHIQEYTHSRMKSLLLDLDVKASSIESVLWAARHLDNVGPSDSAFIYRYLETLLFDNPFIINACLDVWDETLPKDQDTCSTVFYTGTDAEGQPTHRSEWMADNSVNTLEMDAFGLAQASGQSVWSQPYFDSKLEGKCVVSCFQLCDDRGVMLSADVELAALLQVIDSLQFYRHSQMFVVTADGSTYTYHGGMQQVDGIPFDPDRQERIQAHYRRLGLDIVNIVPHNQIYTIMWGEMLVVLLFCILGLTLLSVTVHRRFRKAQQDLRDSLRKSAEEEMTLNRIENELAIAARIQTKMLSSPGKGVHLTSPEGAAADIMSCLVPAREVGGDLYEYRLVGHQLVVCIADVSGKGIPASVLMTKCCTLFNAYVSGTDTPDPAELLRYANAQLCRQNQESIFATMWAGVLDLRDGRLSYSSAGHNSPVIVSDRVSFAEKCQGMPLGLFDDATFRTAICQLAPGDSLLLYTDGITEATGSGNALFGDGRLLAACRESESRNPLVLCHHLLQAVRRYAGESPQSDDITLLCVNYGGHYAQLQSVQDVKALHTLSRECGGNYRTALALEELAVNAFIHGKADFVGAELRDGRWILVDNGGEFDPTTCPLPPQDDDELNIGGRGIRLVRSIASEFTYRRTPDGYNLTCLKL